MSFRLLRARSLSFPDRITYLLQTSYFGFSFLSLLAWDGLLRVNRVWNPRSESGQAWGIVTVRLLSGWSNLIKRGLPCSAQYQYGTGIQYIRFHLQQISMKTEANEWYKCTHTHIYIIIRCYYSTQDAKEITIASTLRHVSNLRRLIR